MLSQSRIFTAVAGATLVVFVVAVVVEDVAISRLSPLTHQVSEYVNDPRLGWVMTVAFAAWAVSLLLSAAVVCIRSAGSAHQSAWRVVGGLLAIAGVAMILTASFHTQTVASVIPRGRHLTSTGRLHDLGSGVTTIALFLAAVATVAALTRNWGKLRARSAGAVISAVVVEVGLLLVGSSVGGLRERLLLGIGCGWQAALLASDENLSADSRESETRANRAPPT